MKRILVVLVLLLAACTGSPPDDPSSSSLSPSTDRHDSSPPITTPPAPQPVRNTTVSGAIVRSDSGAPYPRAWVRFGFLVDAQHEKYTVTTTNEAGRYAIQLPAGVYRVSAGDDCDLNAEFAMNGRAPDDVMISVPEIGRVDFVESPITPGADIPGLC